MYIDILMLLNFAVDLLLLLAADRLCGYSGGWKRRILAAVLGGIYGGVCILPGMEWIGGFWGRLISLGLISGVAFGLRQDAIRRGVMFVFFSMALGGIALTFGVGGFWMILMGAAVVVLMCLFGLRGKVGSKYIPVTIRGERGSVDFLALHDTGNTLVDPISGQQVLVASAGIAMKLLGIAAAELKDPVGLMGKVSGIRLIPYQGVGTEGSLLPARRFEEVTIGNKHGSCLVAFVPHELGKGEAYEALTGGVS